MRKIEFSQLNVKDIYDEDVFYQYYLKNLKKEIKKEKSFQIPEKKYEIFYLNILGGKILLLNKDYLPQSDIENQELFYDYKTAHKIYDYWIDIYNGIENEQFEFNELYKDERLEIDSKIQKLKQKDDEIFHIAMNEYNVIKKSPIYTEYLKLIHENEKLKEINNDLQEKINNQIINKNIGFWQKIINKFRNKKLLNGGENK